MKVFTVNLFVIARMKCQVEALTEDDDPIPMGESMIYLGAIYDK